MSTLAIHQRALTEWSQLNGLTERDHGRDWCGHHLLGKRPRDDHGCPKPHGLSQQFWDHTRGFGTRTPVAILGFPYGPRDEIERDVTAYAILLGLDSHVGDSQGHMSAYFWGFTTPWILAAPGHDARALFSATGPDLAATLAMIREDGMQWRTGAA